jgi:putative FmdB family regulatory protein
MPIYEYHCEDCGQDFEKLVRFSDPKINTPECPGCQSDNTHKRLSVIASLGGINAQTSSASSCGSSGPFR